MDRDIFGNLLSRLEASGTRYELHADGLGSISALTSHNGGAVAATMLYDAWGNLRSSPNSAHGTYRFTGAEWDSTTGLYHMGARFYDPTLGRWLSEDPVQDNAFNVASLNFYTYVNNNPTIHVDPDGRVAIIAILAAGLVELGLAVYDAYGLFRTLRSQASTRDKAISIGLVVLGILGPGGGFDALRGLTAKFLRVERHVKFIEQVARYGDAELVKSLRSYSRNIAMHRERLKAAQASGDTRLVDYLRKEISLYEEQLSIVAEEMLERGLIQGP